jgi:hypothetical protein
MERYMGKNSKNKRTTVSIKKISKKEKEWLKNPTIEINMNDGELEIVGNPFDKEKEEKKLKKSQRKAYLKAVEDGHGRLE